MVSSSLNREKIVLACRKAWEKSGKGKMLLGVSGGADSTALLTAFVKAGIPLEVGHCNYNLRASESLRDREFVKVLCRNFDVKLHLAEFDVPREARKGESVEMTCRRLRYDFFHNLMKEGEFGRIVVAHNADDNIETFFLHALRGSGSKGLMGMEEDNGVILRPLLRYRRKDILLFLKAQQQNYVVDSSNLRSEDFRRNFLRNEVFPLLESKWEGFAKAVTSTLNIQKRENRIVEHFTAKALQGYTDFLPWHVVYNFPDSETLIFRFIKPFGGSATAAAEMAASAASMTPGKTWLLSDGATALFTRKGITIRHAPSTDRSQSDHLYEWTPLNQGDFDINAILISPLTEIYLPGKPEDYDWKNAEIGMKIKSLGMSGSQPVWKVLKDAGLTPDKRKEFPVLIEKATGEPLWLPGIKRARLHLISGTEQTINRLHKKNEKLKNV